jgi:hypothetical protein
MACREISCQNLDCLTINGDPVGSIIPSAPITVPVTLTDSNNGNPVGATNLYITKVGRLVTISVQAFTATALLSSLDSFILTGYDIPAEFLPLNTTGAGINLFLCPAEYTYTLETGVSSIGDIGISNPPPPAPAVPQLVLFGGTVVGGFDTTTAYVTFFNCSASFISAM